MKRFRAYVTFTLVRILVLCAGIMHGDCPSGMIRVGHLCYKWYVHDVPAIQAYKACVKEGGHLAGFENGNFLTTVQGNPMLGEYLPKENCYWAYLPFVSSRLSKLWWLKPVIPDFLMQILGLALDHSAHSKLCYDKTKWVEEIVYVKQRVNFVCEYEVSLFEADGSRHDIKEVTSKSTVVLMVKEFVFIADQPLFEKFAPVRTMCSRLCEIFTGCSMFNFNKITKQCRGFGEMEERHIHYHPDWEVWVFE